MNPEGLLPATNHPPGATELRVPGPGVWDPGPRQALPAGHPGPGARNTLGTGTPGFPAETR